MPLGQDLFSIEFGERPIRLVIAAWKTSIRKRDIGRRNLDISQIGDGCGDLYARYLLNLFVLLDADAAAIARYEIGGDGFARWYPGLWRQHHEIISRSPVLADDLVGLYDGALGGSGEQNKRTSGQKKAPARQDSVTALPPQRRKEHLPHTLYLIRSRQNIS